MTPSATTRQHFAGRYLVARYETGGVVIDVQSGNYFRVNRTAALVCDALAREPSEPAAAHRVARELQIDASEGTKLVDEVLSGLNAPVFHGEPQGSYHFFPSDSGYELRHGQHRVLEISSDGSQVRIAPGAPTVPEAQLELYVRALAPKLLFQRSVRVFHASSCVVGGALIAFAGVSRAGKTTTARAFNSAGAELVSEDLLVLAPDRDAATVLAEGEPRVHEWARKMTVQLLLHPDEPVSAETLAPMVVQGPTRALRSILFVDSQRRAGSDFRTAPLGEADALAELLRHDFLGASEADAWLRFFQHAVALLAQVSVRAMWAPDGVDGLAPAAERYISMTAS